jgi:kynureninase
MGQQDLFEMGPDYQPEPTIRQFLCGTPSILALAAVDAGIDLIAEAGIDALRTKGSALTDYAIDLVDRGLPASFSVGSPREAVRRGSHVSVRHRDAREMCAQLRANKVLPDFRAPDSIRLGMAPLTTSFSDVQRALALLSSMAG